MKKVIIVLLSILAGAAVIAMIYTKNKPDPDRKLSNKSKREPGNESGS
jgi:uncharacterized alpha/beta hydrolase family protein